QSHSLCCFNLEVPGLERGPQDLLDQFSDASNSVHPKAAQWCCALLIVCNVLERTYPSEYRRDGVRHLPFKSEKKSRSMNLVEVCVELGRSPYLGDVKQRSELRGSMRLD